MTPRVNLPTSFSCHFLHAIILLEGGEKIRHLKSARSYKNYNKNVIKSRGQISHIWNVSVKWYFEIIIRFKNFPLYSFVKTFTKGIFLSIKKSFDLLYFYFWILNSVIIIEIKKLIYGVNFVLRNRENQFNPISRNQTSK